ncbi:MAG: chromate efflux transporter [Dehalococcoidia bacterium]|nr:chromate efflux transporter [Dehalococcoidia bacterium]
MRDGERGSAWEVFLVALRLGLTSFGGPIAHIGYFREEYVVRRRWLDDQQFADLLALTNFLPGPASSQTGIAIGTMRAGYLGGLLSWVGFTLPSALALVAFAQVVRGLDVSDAGWLHGLKIAAVAVVAQAVWAMSRNLAPDRERATIAVAAAGLVLMVATPATQVLAILLGGIAGWLLYRRTPDGGGGAFAEAPRRLSPRIAAASLALFVLLLVALPVVRAAAGSQTLNLVDAFYRAGSLVFGGGHVVLPLLEREVVPPGWITQSNFIAGYGAAQAVPGPLFTFSAYLGASLGPQPNGAPGAAVALSALFLPSFLLVWGVLPFWDHLRRISAVQAALRGIGAAVVGILVAALYDPVWTSAIFEPQDLALALVALVLLAAWRLPPWLVVVVAATGGEALARL